MSSSLAWAAPIANTATAPKQVVSRKLRIGILPATMPRVTDAKAHSVPRVGTRSMGRLPAACHSATRHNLTLMPAWLTNIRQHSRKPTYLKPEAARSLFPRFIDCNHHFWRLLSQPGLTPPSISTWRRISSVSCANEAFHADHSCIGRDRQLSFPAGDIWSAIEEKQLTECRR